MTERGKIWKEDNGSTHVRIGTVVEHSTTNPEIKGLNPAPFNTGRVRKEGEKVRENENWVGEKEESSKASDWP